MLAWLNMSFSDREMIPVKPPAATDGSTREHDLHTPWLHITLVGFAQFFGWLGFVAIEGSLSLIVVEAYGERSV